VFDGIDALRCLWVILVDQVIYRAQQVVKPSRIRLEIAGQQQQAGAERA
jgi:hypothetical protein